MQLNINHYHHIIDPKLDEILDLERHNHTLLHALLRATVDAAQYDKLIGELKLPTEKLDKAVKDNR